MSMSGRRGAAAGAALRTCEASGPNTLPKCSTVESPWPVPTLMDPFSGPASIAGRRADGLLSAGRRRQLWTRTDTSTASFPPSSISPRGIRLRGVTRSDMQAVEDLGGPLTHLKIFPQ